MKYLIEIFFILLIFTGCKTEPPVVQDDHIIKENQDKTFTGVRGMVYDLDREPVSGATVTLHKGAMTRITSTDIHGRFVLPDVDFGQLELVFEKTGYEPFSWKLLFSERSQVVYVQMADADQLYESAVNLLDQKDWSQAQDFLDRADKLDKGSATSCFLRAELLNGQNKSDEAVILLETYLSSKEEVLAMELLLGDIYEKKLKENSKAVIHLEKSLQMKYDPEVEARVNNLKGLEEK